MNKKISTVINVSLLTIFICITVAFLYTYDYVGTLTHELKQRDVTIEALNRKDSIKQSILDDKVKSVKSETNIISSGEVVRYANDMSKTIDSLYSRIILLHKENFNCNDSLRYYKIYYDFSQQKYNHKYIVVKNSSGGRNYSFEPNAISYNDFKKYQDQIASLAKEITEITSSLNMYKHAAKKYNITFKNISNKKEGSFNYISYDIFAPTLDSALMLLPVYKNKLKFDSKNNEWSVGGKMFIKYVKIEKDSIK